MTDAGTENNSMALNQALCWYQKKISAYDKQSWEETVEQRILSGLAHVPKKSGKLKLEYIDLDLVRGSAFPKVKAKHGLGTVIRLGLARFALLPFYKHWWTRQTSPRIYNILFILYSLQLFNMMVFFMNTSTVLTESEAGSNTTIGDATESSLGEISSEEVLLPILMMGILSVLLSQMGSAHTSTGRQAKRPRSKLRTRRAKRRSNRRISIVVSDSKSSLETLEQPAEETQVKQVPSFPVKKRSCSEERPTPVKTQQRSSSLQLEPSLVKRKTVGIQRRPSWFSFWPARLGVPSRTNEDEGFDSFHGNNSSSSDVEPEENTEQAAAPKDEDVAELSGPSLLRRRRHALTLKVAPPPLSPQPEIDLLHGGSEGTARKSVTILGCQRRSGSIASMGVTAESSYQSSCESDGDGQSSVASPSYKVSEPGTPMDWTGVTTNSEECSYSSETGSESDRAESPHFSNMDPWGDEIGYAWDLHSSAALSSSFPASDKVSCTVWEAGEPKKADLSVLDISAAIIAKVDSVPESTDYLCGGLFMAAVFSLLPIMYRANGTLRNTVVDLARAPSLEKLSQASAVLWDTLLGASFWEKVVAGTAALERFVLAAGFLFLLSVAERTFKQRFLYSKLFSYLTSSRRARNSDLPHFRLNKVRNIKTWLSVRSYLKKRGPQRSVDCIVSTAFVITLLLVSFLCMELLKESQYLHQSLYNLEVLCWCLVLGVFLLRFMTLGSKINKKYRNLSVLITEQINLYLQMEQKPTKKEELMLANNVLKLAADLLKELESPFKISGFSANPYLYNLTKVVVLSALSGVLSEMLGFKLKLHKIKLR